MAKVLVKARGRKRRPVSPPRAKMGRKETVSTKRAKKSDGPTSLAASRMRGSRGASGGACSICLWEFSTMTTEASTMAPMAMAMPARLRMLALMLK